MALQQKGKKLDSGNVAVIIAQEVGFAVGLGWSMIVYVAAGFVGAGTLGVVSQRSGVQNQEGILAVAGLGGAIGAAICLWRMASRFAMSEWLEDGHYPGDGPPPSLFAPGTATFFAACFIGAGAVAALLMLTVFRRRVSDQTVLFTALGFAIACFLFLYILGRWLA